MPDRSLTVSADALTVLDSGVIAASTSGPGPGGDIVISVSGDLIINRIANSSANTGVFARTIDPRGGNAGRITVAAENLDILNGGLISTSTFGAGRAGEVSVNASGMLVIDGSGAIASSANSGPGDAGQVTVTAGSVTISGGGEVQSVTHASGNGGTVQVTARGPLALTDPGSGIIASATSTASGDAGSTVMANALTIEGGAQIASSTAGPGKGGDINVAVASDILLPDRGPQITAESTGSGDAGSITVSAVRLLMNNDAAISTKAATSTASGGNITLKVGDFLYLVSSEISTSVKGETGNGGNIAIDPQLVILNHSSIIAQAIEGHGGNITITADQFIPSSDSVVSASSELGISGTVVINGPRVDVNGALVVLSTQLRGRTEVLREACAARADRPISSLVEAGRGGLPQDPEATLPALYIADRDVNLNPQLVEKSTETTAALHTTVRLTMRCG